MHLGSVSGSADRQAEVTGSVTRKPVAAKRIADKIPDADLAMASAVAADAMGKPGNASAPWENPKTGARGMVTPIAAAYQQDGATCRDFLASYLSEDSEAWLQGEACRVQQGTWVVRSLKPWKRA